MNGRITRPDTRPHLIACPQPTKDSACINGGIHTRGGSPEGRRARVRQCLEAGGRASTGSGRTAHRVGACARTRQPTPVGSGPPMDTACEVARCGERACPRSTVSPCVGRAGEPQPGACGWRSGGFAWSCARRPDILAAGTIDSCANAVSMADGLRASGRCRQATAPVRPGDAGRAASGGVALGQTIGETWHPVLASCSTTATPRQQRHPNEEHSMSDRPAGAAPPLR
jgi:hypothetical protein